MRNDTLEEALNADYIPLKDFNPDDSIQKWWNAKCRRPVRTSPKLINNDDMVKMMKLKMMSLMMNPVPTCLMAGMNLHMIEFTR